MHAGDLIIFCKLQSKEWHCTGSYKQFQWLGVCPQAMAVVFVHSGAYITVCRLPHWKYKLGYNTGLVSRSTNRSLQKDPNMLYFPPLYCNATGIR